MREYYIEKIQSLEREIKALKEKNHDQARHINRLQAQVFTEKNQNAALRAEFDRENMDEITREKVEAFPRYLFVGHTVRVIFDILWERYKSFPGKYIKSHDLHGKLYEERPSATRPGKYTVHVFIHHLRGDLKFTSFQIGGKYKEGWRLEKNEFPQESTPKT